MNTNKVNQVLLYTCHIFLQYILFLLQTTTKLVFWKCILSFIIWYEKNWIISASCDEHRIGMMCPTVTKYWLIDNSTGGITCTMFDWKQCYYVRNRTMSILSSTKSKVWWCIWSGNIYWLRPKSYSMSSCRSRLISYMDSCRWTKIVRRATIS